MIIDAHTHAFPDFLAERAVNQLAGQLSRFAPPSHNGTVKGLLGEMDRSGVERAILCSIATAPGQTRSIIIWNCQIRNERLIPMPSLHPENDDPAGLVAEIHSLGFKGIKLHPMFQGHVLDGEGYAPICAAAEALGLVIVFHAGFDLAYPTDDAASPARLARVLDRYPRLRVMATHFGGWNAWDAVYEHLAGRENVYFGTSFTFGFIQEKFLFRILERHTADRVMFGTDSPWESQADQIGRLKALGLGPETEQKILGLNAARFFGLGPEDAGGAEP